MSAQKGVRDEGFVAASPAAAGQAPGDVSVPPGSASVKPCEIKIGKTVVSREGEQTGVLTEVFTMTIGTETIELLPFKNWTQLDAFKWRARGILPRTPAGLEITWNQLKVAGRTVSRWDPDACGQIEEALNEWLQVEHQGLELARTKAQVVAARESAAPSDEDGTVHFKLDLTNPEQPKLSYLEGNETVKVVALNLAGLTALIEEGLMRKPGALKVGALHNWVELDGHLFRFREDPNQANELEQALNENYRIEGDLDAPPDVLVFPNPASPTGFDVQFPANAMGVAENRKRHLNEETVQLLQDPERCRVLRKGITVRLASPDLVFKLKTPEGGERELEPGPESTVSVAGEDGQQKRIELSKPVSLLNLGARELTAVFNHPTINRRARLAAKSRNRSS